MELFLPEQIALSPATMELMEDVAETTRRLAAFRPLPSSVMHRIVEELLGERVQASNAIEGNTLDLRETLVILAGGALITSKRRESLEARNLGIAAQTISDWINQKLDRTVHTVERLLEVHSIIFRDINDDWGGIFTPENVVISGAKHQPPDRSLVPTLVERVMERLRQPGEAPPLLLASWAHWALARIHPFRDGNGRIARLWQDLLLFQSDMTCAIIRPEDRRHYLEALTAADEGEFNLLVQLVSQRTASTLDRYFVHMDQDREADSWVEQLVGETDDRTQDRLKLEFQRWSRLMELLKFELEQCATRINHVSSTTKIQVRKYPMIDQARWESLRAGRGATLLWFLLVDFSGLKRRRYCFFFGKHYWLDDLDYEEDRSEDRVCLLLGEYPDSGDFTRVDQIPNSPVLLCEVFSVGDSLVRKRWGPIPLAGDARVFIYDRNVSAMTIVREFIEQVIMFRLTAC